MHNRFSHLYLLFAICLCLANYAQAGNLDMEGNMSLWWNIYEQNENGIMQARTQDPAADVASGFNLKQGRISFDCEDAERSLGARLQIRLEERVSLLDGYGFWRPFNFLSLYLGQMKVPSTYEALTSDNELDFISGTTLSRNLADWSLSRSPYYSALYGSRSYNRDLGVGIKGVFGPNLNPELVSYFLMIGNGLGANLFIGGRESKEFMFSNNPGDYFYGARLDISPINCLTLGGHYSLNRHDNMLFNDEKTVFDLDRYSWSMDSRLEFSRVLLAAMYGTGKVDDNYFYTAQKDLSCSGYEVKSLIWLIHDLVQIGARYDTYTYKFLESGLSTDQNNLTIGINATPTRSLRLQLNYILKDTQNESEPDLGDNILFLNIQYSFNIKG